jgi:hypothetical protein
MQVEIVSHMEVECKPRKAPKTLHPIPKPTKSQRLLAPHMAKISLLSSLSPAYLAFLRRNVVWGY